MAWFTTHRLRLVRSQFRAESVEHAAYFDHQVVDFVELLFVYIAKVKSGVKVGLNFSGGSVRNIYKVCKFPVRVPAKTPSNVCHYRRRRPTNLAP